MQPGASGASMQHGLAAVGLHPTTSLAPNVEETHTTPSLAPNVGAYAPNVEETYTAPPSAPPDAKTVAEMEHIMAEMHDVMSDIKDRVAAIDNAQIETSRAIANNT